MESYRLILKRRFLYLDRDSIVVGTLTRTDGKPDGATRLSLAVVFLEQYRVTRRHALKKTKRLRIDGASMACRKTRPGECLSKIAEKDTVVNLDEKKDWGNEMDVEVDQKFISPWSGFSYDLVDSAFSIVQVNNALPQNTHLAFSVGSRM